MKVKDIIKKLQELDPSGELHVSGDGAIIDIGKLPGYYDGCGIYLSPEEDDGEPKKLYLDYIQDKIRIIFYDIHDYIWSHDGDYSGIEILGNESNKERWLPEFQKISEEVKRFDKNMKRTHLYDIIDKLTQGYRILCETEHIGMFGYYAYVKKGIDDIDLNKARRFGKEEEGYKNMNSGDFQVIMYSGFFHTMNHNKNLVEYILML